MQQVTLFFKRSTGIALLIAISWQFVFTIVGYLLTSQQGLLGHMYHWDAGWYHHIIEYAYNTTANPAAPAFYPLMPLLVGGLHFLSIGLIPETTASLIINTASLWLALIFLIRILQNYKLSTTAQCVGIAIFLSFPSAFFMHVFYSEALFIALGFGAYYFALTKKWWVMGVFLALLTAARLPSILFILLCGLEYLNVYKWNIQKAFNKNVCWFLLAPIGFISYALYLFILRGDALAMFHAYSATNDWVYQQFDLNIFATLYATTSTIISSLLNGVFNYEIFINYTLPLVILLLVGWASLYCVLVYKKRGIPLAVFGVLSIVLFTLNSNVISVHRYTLACIVIYIALASLVNHRKKWLWIVVLAIIASLCLQLFLYGKFINDIFAG